MLAEVEREELAAVIGGSSTSTVTARVGEWKHDLFEVHESDRDACLKAARKRGEKPATCDPIRSPS